MPKAMCGIEYNFLILKEVAFVFQTEQSLGRLF
jgi:hypothetical protein